MGVKEKAERVETRSDEELRELAREIVEGGGVTIREACAIAHHGLTTGWKKVSTGVWPKPIPYNGGSLLPRQRIVAAFEAELLAGARAARVPQSAKVAA